MTDEMTVFDRRLVRARRDRAAPGFDDFDFLFREVADRLADRGEVWRHHNLRTARRKSAEHSSTLNTMHFTAFYG